MTRKRRLAQQEAEEAELVARWNRMYKPGQPVTVKKDDGREVETATRSVAWLLGGTAVIQLVGISGGYMVSRCWARTVPGPDVRVVHPASAGEGDV